MELPRILLAVLAVVSAETAACAETASGSRVDWCDGMCFFVDDNAPFFHNGRSANPFATLSQGISAADGGGDIVMIRAGKYPERLTIRHPVTLRAPRGQTARIGQ